MSINGIGCNTMCHQRIVTSRYAWLRQEQAKTQMEIPKSAHNQFDKLKGSLADKSGFGDEESPFHDVGPANREVRRGLEERLVYALGLSKGGINIEVADFHGKIHVEEQDYKMLEPIYNEYPNQIEDVLPVQEEPLIVHKVKKSLVS